MESAGKAEYGKPLTAKYWDFTHVIRYAFHLSSFQSVPHSRPMSMCIFVLKLAADIGEYRPINVEAAFSLRLHVKDLKSYLALVDRGLSWAEVVPEVAAGVVRAEP